MDSYLEITMGDSHEMTVTDGIDNRADCVACFLFTIILLLDDAVEEFSTSHELHDHVELVLGVEDLKQLHDVRMIDLGEDFYLIPDYQLIMLFKCAPYNLS